jgi:phosphopantothenoylcysteine decarboxylase/phosphopantothenate--cysteine ligase
MADRKLAGKRIALGVSGSIAAYKAAELLRRLLDEGADVRVILTGNAQRFISALTFRALSGKSVLTDEFSDTGWGPMGHISVTDDLDLLLIAPATANIIAKAAAGIADDALSTVLVAASCPVIMAPAMNDRMYRNAVLRKNRDALQAAGVRFVEPATGELACGVRGQGRLADTEDILAAVRATVRPSGSLAGLKIVVTAGPTREPVDAVRFISNPSTGKMGFALAEEARSRGATVVLVSGPSCLPTPEGIHRIPVVTASQMKDAVEQEARSANIVIMAAAVSDFRPVEPEQKKLKKDTCDLSVRLERTEDILLSLGRMKNDRLLVGFAAETEDVVRNAQEKLMRKNLDLIVANDISAKGAGFESETNIVTLIDRFGVVNEVPRMDKRAVAARILDKIVELMANQGL